MKLDHSVRTVNQCRTVAGADLSAAVGLLDITFVAGEEDVVNAAKSTVAHDWRANARTRLPQLQEQIPAIITRTRPELSKDLTAVLAQLQPEFAKKGGEMIDIAARIYARRLSEEDLKATAAFFDSPAGKNYVAAQPLMLDELVLAMQAWTQETSSFMMKRVQQEMEKKGDKF